MEFTFDRLCNLSYLGKKEYNQELEQLLSIIQTATEIELLHIEDVLIGYMARGKGLLNKALWKRKTVIKQEKRYKKSSLLSFFTKKPKQSKSKDEHAKTSTNQRGKRLQKIVKNDFHQLPDCEDHNSLFQDPDKQLHFQISS